MSNAQLKVVVRVFKRRIQNGESFEDVAETYPKLTADELKKIKEMIK